jgi:hypothetical protein
MKNQPNLRHELMIATTDLVTQTLDQWKKEVREWADSFRQGVPINWSVLNPYIERLRINMFMDEIFDTVAAYLSSNYDITKKQSEGMVYNKLHSPGIDEVRDKIFDSFNMNPQPLQFDIPEYEKIQGFSQAFRKAWKKFANDIIDQECIWTLHPTKDCVRPTEIRAVIEAVQIKCMGGQDYCQVPHYLDWQSDIHLVLRECSNSSSQRYSLKDFDSIRVIAAPNEKSKPTFPITIQWQLAKKIYELHRQIIENCNHELVVLRDKDKNRVPWDKIDTELYYEIQEDYLYIADELLNGLVAFK